MCVVSLSYSIMDNTAVIIDFQCFFDDNGKYIVKELSIMDVLRFAGRHWIFTPPATSVTNPKYARTNHWLTSNYHRLRWSEGETPYDNLVSLLTSHTRIYKCVCEGF